ncbi:hypothetical protein RQP46_001985 [Phenoliferia psychrophenolica]
MNNPVVILTGASKGIGLATLNILLRASVNVVSVSRTETPELTSLAAKYPGVLVISLGDVSKDEDNKAAVDVAMQSFSRLDGVILNAGTLSPLGTIASMKGKVDEVEGLFRVNFLSLVSLLSHAIPYLNSKENKPEAKDGVTGRIVLVSSGAATGGVAGWGAYSASKAAMNSLARTLGNEESSIVTVAVRPGVVDTGMQLAIRETGLQHMKAEDHKKFSGLHESGNLIPPHKPGGILAGLALAAEPTLSGSFVDWNDVAMDKYKRE